MNVDNYISARQNRINDKLNIYLPSAQLKPQRLHEAMRYTVLTTGKRLRPLLVYATGEMLGAHLEALDVPAAAVELIHAYSLAHDDLPAMDNDDLRRGQPTCHKAFDEATAILVGDALQAFAFELLSTNNSLTAEQHLQMLRYLAKGCGSQGMVGGQALELVLENSASPSRNLLDTVHYLKTAMLIRVSIQLGALAAGAKEAILIRLGQFADDFGLAFQIQDDILDQAEDPNSLSYPNFLGIDEAKRHYYKLRQQAYDQLSFFGDEATPLRLLIEYALNTNSDNQ